MNNKGSIKWLSLISFVFVQTAAVSFPSMAHAADGNAMSEYDYLPATTSESEVEFIPSENEEDLGGLTELSDDLKESLSDQTDKTEDPSKTPSTFSFELDLHSEQEILDFLAAHPTSTDLEKSKVTWDEKPSLEYPYAAGRLSDETVTSALNLVNNIRYIAGLNADITLNDEYSRRAQAYAYIRTLERRGENVKEALESGKLDPSLYSLAMEGKSNCNYASTMGHSLNYVINNRSSADYDNSYLAGGGYVGELFALNPTLTQTGFGMVSGEESEYGYVTMYVDKEQTVDSGAAVMWPAPITPIEYFDCDCSTSWGLLINDYENENITVTLTRRADAVSWKFYEHSPDGEVSVHRADHGYWVTFNPGQNGVGLYQPGDIFDVSVKGLATGDVNYSVRFISSEKTAIALNKSVLTLKPGESEKLFVKFFTDDPTCKVISWENTSKSIATVSNDGTVTAKGCGSFCLHVTAMDGKKRKYSAHCWINIRGDAKISFELMGGIPAKGEEYEISVPCFTDNNSQRGLWKRPKDPIRPGYVFDGWYSCLNRKEGKLEDGYLTESGETVYTIDDPWNIRYYAKWIAEDGSEDPYVYNIEILEGEKLSIHNRVNYPSEWIYFDVIDMNSHTDGRTKVSITGKYYNAVLNAKNAGEILLVPHVIENGPDIDLDNCTIEVIILPKPKLRFSRALTYETQTVSAGDCFNGGERQFSYHPVAWTSSNPKVAQINESTGEISVGSKNGSTVITAFFCKKGLNGAMNTLKVSAPLTVKHPYFAKSSYSLLVGQTMTMNMKNVTNKTNPIWKSSDEAGVYVTSKTTPAGVNTGKAVIKALKSGEYTITSYIDEMPYTCLISVKPPIITKASVSLKVNKKATIGLKNIRLKKNEIVWETDRPDIVEIAAGGIIKGKKAGSALVFTNAGGVYNECAVTVY
ncbi:MAG: Ig-like domain-containing protein [Lachnospiraceae bacterium]|nr:Ig-like domain-containing protein [Lachnospiraceae bacterium]